MSDIVFRQVKIGPMANFQYVFGSLKAGSAAIVDPGFEPKAMRRTAEALGLAVTHILVTHAHWDHVQSLPELRRWTKAQVVAHAEGTTDPDVAVKDGQRLTIAGVPVVAHHMPGHSPDMVNYVVDDSWLLTGDALFIGDCGRVDLPGSDVQEMWRTLQERFSRLPEHLVVCPGHDYGPAPSRSLAQERASNPCLQPRDIGAFIKFMAEP